MMLKLLAASLLCAALGAVLSELGFKGKRIFAALALTLILCGVLGGASDIISSVLGIAEGAGIGAAARVALKVVGLGYVFGLVGDVCEELGERGIASAVTVAGRIEILVLVFPYFLEICALGKKL
jgi:hypothetical protein